jgi:kynurenine formamidase
MAREAWGRWGPDDEIGALNLVGEEQRLAALALVRQGRVVSLAITLGEDTPSAGHRGGFRHFMDRDGGDYPADARRPGGFQFAEDTILLETHSGTHLDALCHVWYDDQLYNGFSSRSIRSTKGATKNSVGMVPPVVTRGILLDFVAEDGAGLQPGDRIALPMITKAFDKIGLAPRDGDVVLLRTGWIEGSAALGERYFDGEPGIDVEAAEWLAEHGVAVVGADNYAVEAIPFDEGAVFPVHQRLLRDFGVLLLESVSLKELADHNATEFAFVMAALPLMGATASPVHPFAVL